MLIKSIKALFLFLAGIVLIPLILATSIIIVPAAILAIPILGIFFGGYMGIEISKKHFLKKLFPVSIGASLGLVVGVAITPVIGVIGGIISPLVIGLGGFASILTPFYLATIPFQQRTHSRVLVPELVPVTEQKIANPVPAVTGYKQDDKQQLVVVNKQIVNPVNQYSICFLQQKADPKVLLKAQEVHPTSSRGLCRGLLGGLFAKTLLTLRRNPSFTKEQRNMLDYLQHQPK